MRPIQSYRLYIDLTKNLQIQAGKLGLFIFPKGNYVYTGSAKKNIDKRINRHLLKNKNLYWHIDYFLASENSKVLQIIKSDLGECDLNKKLEGRIIAKGFGSSDCKQNCGSHLKLIDV